MVLEEVDDMKFIDHNMWAVPASLVSPPGKHFSLNPSCCPALAVVIVMLVSTPHNPTSVDISPHSRAEN